MFNNKFVLSILVNSSVVTENLDGTVPIEFGKEYSLRVRNKHNRRALANISIDGEDITEGGIIIPANSYIDLERPVNQNAKFKFVSANSPDAITEGKDPNNYKLGLIEVRLTLEKEEVYKPTKPYPNTGQPIIYPPYTPPTTWSPLYGNGIANDTTSYSCCCTNQAPNLETGATVPGSSSNQSFTETHFNTDYYAVAIIMQLRLVGYDSPRAKAIAAERKSIQDKLVQLENEKYLWQQKLKALKD